MGNTLFILKGSFLPLVKAEVSVCELHEQGSLQDLLGRLVLDEVNDDVLQSMVVLRRRVFLR